MYASLLSQELLHVTEDKQVAVSGNLMGTPKSMLEFYQILIINNCVFRQNIKHVSILFYFFFYKRQELENLYQNLAGTWLIILKCLLNECMHTCLFNSQ